MRHTQHFQLFCVTLFLVANVSHAPISRAFEIPYQEWTISFSKNITAAVSQTATQPLQVPQANMVTIDGRLGEEEWKAALKQELVGGGELRLQHDGSFLYVGVRGMSHGWCHLYVTDGDTIFVHHVSAALGTTTYLQKGELWQPQQKFVWELRDRGFTPQAEAARAAYLKSKGWLANNMNMGMPGIIEFKIARRFLKGEIVRLAVAFASDPAAPQYWPETLADDCRKRELISGSSPADLKFNRESWAKLELMIN